MPCLFYNSVVYIVGLLGNPLQNYCHFSVCKNFCDSMAWFLLKTHIQ